MSASRNLTKEEQAVSDIITSHNALISIVFDVDWGGDDRNLPYIDYKSIDEDYLDQISDPNKNRPSRSAIFFDKDRPAVIKKMNMKTGKKY